MYANELKVHEKTLRTVIKQDLIPDINTLVKAIWGILEKKKNKCNFQSNIRSHRTAIGGMELNVRRTNFEGMQIVSNVYWYNYREKIVAILNKFSILCLSSYFVDYIFNQN